MPGEGLGVSFAPAFHGTCVWALLNRPPRISSSTERDSRRKAARAALVALTILFRRVRRGCRVTHS